MIRLILILLPLALLLSAFSGFIVLALAWRQVSKYLEQRRLRQLLQMQSYHRRLKLIVSELLAKANDLDEQSKYIVHVPDPSWSKQLSGACVRLVILSDSLNLIEQKLKKCDVKQSREIILSSCRIAFKVSVELQGLENVRQLRVEPEKNHIILPAPDYELTQKKEKKS